MKLAWDIPEPPVSGYERKRSDDLYHSARWTKLARAFRTAHPLCAECQRKGIITAAECVDHIDPWPICEDYFFDTTNLQALCYKCNLEKGNKDKKRIQEWRREGGSNL